jgi:hypothetical protein
MIRLGTRKAPENKKAPRSRKRGRYTPPVPRTKKVSPKWMGPLIIALMVLGVVFIILNYMNVLPGGASDWYLVGGLGVILVGFILATRYR